MKSLFKKQMKNKQIDRQTDNEREPNVNKKIENIKNDDDETNVCRNPTTPFLKIHYVPKTVITKVKKSFLKN